MSKIKRIQESVRNGLYYLTEHADDEAMADNFDIYDVENGMLTGRIRRTWPREGKYEVVGWALDKGETVMEFWQGERCEYCEGLIVEKKVSLSRKVKGKYVVIENVPAGVCTKCGTRYYAANVLKTLEETVRGRRKAKREILVPVYSL